MLLPKGEPQARRRARARRLVASVDKAQSEIVKARSGGQCEVTVAGVRCWRPATEVHHQIGGWRRRARGASALAENKTHCCATCHERITGTLGGTRYKLAHVAGNVYQ